MIYLDNAAGSHPKPLQVVAALQQACSLYGANPGRGCYQMSRDTSAMVGKTREKLAALFKVKTPERLIFTAGATMSLNMALFGLLKPGSHLIISGMEHNAVWRPAAALEKAGTITLTRIKPDAQGYVRAADFAAAIRPETALLACIQASNVNGVLQPIAEIGAVAKKRGIPLLVDASQSAGLVDIDVERDQISLLAIAGHKYLYGLAGTGGLYVAPNLKLQSFLYGGTGNKSELREQPEFYPDHLEAGSLNTPGIAALGAACDFVTDTGVAALYDHSRELFDRLRNDLANIAGVTLQTPLEPQAAVVPVLSFTVAGKTAGEVAAALDGDFAIAVRAGYHCAPLAHRALSTMEEGTVRLSPGWFNTREEMAQAALAVQKIARGK